MKRLLGRTCVALVVGTVPVLAPPPAPAAPAITVAAAEATFADVVNRERGGAGLDSLQLDETLSAVARRHSVRMREAGRIFHNDALASEVPKPWSMIAENVGRGPSPEVVEAVFARSAGHRDNILGDFDRFGVGVAVAGKTIYVTQIFVKN